MSDSTLTIVAIVAAFVVAFVLVRVVHAVVHRTLDAMEVSEDEGRKALHARAARLLWAMRLLAYGVAALASVSFALARFGIAEPRWHPRVAGRWLLTHGVNLTVIILGGATVLRAANLTIEYLQQRLARRHARNDLEWQRRASTLGGILTSTVTVTVWFAAILMLLREFAIDIMPILTGAGIAGLAIGFGAQNLVRDVISGFFIILEDQVRVGDLARINGVAGAVEQINLRTIVMRDPEGAVQVFPNGTITALANLSKQYAYAVVEVKVAYSENLDRVFNTIREVGRDMQADPNWGSVLLEPIDIAGVVSIADGRATISSKFKTLPLNQGRVANELRRRLLGALARRGINPVRHLTMSITDYHFVTRWRVEGTSGEVADVLRAPLDLARWWPAVYLAVEEMSPPGADGLGQRVRVRTKGFLPYTLEWEFAITESRYPVRFALEAFGDFVGSGVWTIEQDGAFVNATYDWRIRTERLLLQRLSPFLRPLLESNHRWAMARGEESLALELRRRRASSEEERRSIPPPPGPVTYAAVGLLAGAAVVGGALGYLILRRRRKVEGER